MSFDKEQENHNTSLYTQLCMVYNHTEFPCILKLLRTLSYGTPFNTRYPVLKLLKAVCRRLLINYFESVFFCYIVRVNNWNIHDDNIRRHVSDVRDIVCYSADDEDYKALTLYLLLCGYTVKFYLNYNAEIYVNEMERVCPGFRTVFYEWAKQYWTTLRIHPKNLNLIYKQISLKTEPKHIQADYNSLVDQLLQISPSYNPYKYKVDNATLKRELAETKPIKKYANTPPAPISESVANLSILCSSTFIQKINPAGTNSTFNLGENKKAIVNIGSSVFGLQLLAPLDDEVVTDIKDVTLGLSHGHSDSYELYPPARKYFREDERNENELNLRKNISNTSDYLISN